MHTVGNNPRNHAIYASIEELFRLTPAYPAANLEPYYTGWNHQINRPGGETPAENSDRDNYFARAMMYGSVLSGALAGHVHGTAAYDVTSTGEPAGWRPHIWTALRYESGAQMQHLRDFVLSEGDRYQELALASQDLEPRSIPDALADGLDGWSFLMRTADEGFALPISRTGRFASRMQGSTPGARYRWTWFDPRTGEWGRAAQLKADAAGVIACAAISRWRRSKPRSTSPRRLSGRLEPELRVAVVNVVGPVGRAARMHRAARLDQRVADTRAQQLAIEHRGEGRRGGVVYGPVRADVVRKAGAQQRFREAQVPGACPLPRCAALRLRARRAAVARIRRH